VNPVAYAFLGPLVGAATRSFSGWMADRWGGARVTIYVFVVMMLAAGGVLYFIDHRADPGAFWGFLAMFLVLFAASGVGNASTFQMVPAIFRTLHFRRANCDTTRAQAQKASATESAAVLGFTSAVAAAGAFFIPKGFGTSIALTGSPAAAVIGFMAFYLTCLAMTWWFYVRQGAPVRIGGAKTEAAPVAAAE
jgi:NNP family nitrate/nitrite transporter-like MFS transporter